MIIKCLIVCNQLKDFLFNFIMIIVYLQKMKLYQFHFILFIYLIPYYYFRESIMPILFSL